MDFAAKEMIFGCIRKLIYGVRQKSQTFIILMAAILSFTPREYQKPALDFAEILEPMQAKIKIRIHKSILDRVLDFCTYEHISPDCEEYYIVSFPFIENEYYYNILLSFGDKCECLEPLHIRTEMKRRIQKISALYEN